VRKIRMLRSKWRGWKPTYGFASEALPEETGSNGEAEPTEHGASPRPYKSRESLQYLSCDAGHI
jgi:hypothetical protein